MTKKAESTQEENQAAAENLEQAASEFLEKHEGDLPEATVNADGVIEDSHPAPSGIPTAAEIRMAHKPEPEQPFEEWFEATRNQLGGYLRENAKLLAEGTELEFKYQTTNPTDRVQWSNHYLKFQHELQKAGYAVFMIGRADDPYLRIRLGDGRKVVAE